jgi:hypothetical protein
VPLTDFFDDAEPFKDRRRVELEARLKALIRRLSQADAEVALGQIELLARRRKS